MATQPKFKPELFNNALKSYGLEVLVEKSAVCSCYTVQQSEADPNCPICKGLRHVWKPYGVITALLTSIHERNNAYIDFTAVKQGDRMLTTLPWDKLALNDKVKPLSMTESYSELIEPTEQDGKVWYKPYFEVASIEKILGDGGVEQDLSLFSYDIARNAIQFLGNGNIGKLSFRYFFYPHYLVTDIPHTNRQQYANSGVLNQLPNQYLLSMISAPVRTAYIPGLVSKDVLKDFSNIQEGNEFKFCTKQEYDTELSFSNESAVGDQSVSVNLQKLDGKTTLTFELFFRSNNTDNILKFEDDFKGVIKTKARISSSWDVTQNEGRVAAGDLFVLIRDVYQPEGPFANKPLNMLAEYLGGDVLSSSSWKLQIPNDGVKYETEMDFRPDFEDAPSYYIYDAESAQFVKKRETLQFKSDELLKVFLGEDSDIVNARVHSNSWAYFAVAMTNNSRPVDFFMYLDGEAYLLKVSKFSTGIFYKRKVTILDEKQLVKVARIYSRKLTQFEMASNMSFLKSNV